MSGSQSIKKLTDENFDQGISSGVVLVDFYADWCGPCRMLNPVIDELAQLLAGKLLVVKVDTDQAIHTAARFEVTSIPTLLLFVNGNLVKRVVGLKDLDTLKRMISEYIK